MVQEHWLFKCQLHLLSEISQEYNVSRKSVDFFDPITPAQIPRGFGGVAIYWKKTLDHLITDIEIGNERIKCIKFETDHPLFIVCVYLPCIGEKDNYHTFVETIEQLQ